MKLTNSKEIMEFRFAIGKCKGSVWLKDPDGNIFNLKSVISHYIALGRLLEEQGDLLELFCDNKDDEVHFRKFFKENPGVL